MPNPRPLLGSGMAGMAVDKAQLADLYKRRMMDGITLPPFDQWANPKLIQMHAEHSNMMKQSGLPIPDYADWYDLMMKKAQIQGPNGQI